MYIWEVSFINFPKQKTSVDKNYGYFHKMIGFHLLKFVHFQLAKCFLDFNWKDTNMLFFPFSFTFV